MSLNALRWAMNLTRPVMPGSPYTLAVVRQLAWLDHGTPFYVSVPYLSEHTGLDARTVRRAVALLETCGVIRATGQMHRNMRLFEFTQVIEPLSPTSGVKDAQPLTQTSGVKRANGHPPPTPTSGVGERDPSHSCTQPLTSMHATPDVDVPQKVLRGIENKTGPVVNQGPRGDDAPGKNGEDPNGVKEREFGKMRAIVHSKKVTP